MKGINSQIKNLRKKSKKKPDNKTANTNYKKMAEFPEETLRWMHYELKK